jgi:PhnB protein
MAVQAKPEGYATVTPAIVVAGAGGLIDFMKDAFGATERMRMAGPDGRVAHAELQLGDSVVMVGDETPDFATQTAALHMYVEDCDEVFRKAMAAGATSLMEPADQFYGDRSGTVRDAWGNRWTISTHIEDVSDEEAMKRMEAMAQQGQG